VAGLAVGVAVLAGVGTAGAATVVLPPANAKFDYQIGAAYTPPSGVQVVSRDRLASPAPGIYNICYVNAYQTQPDEANWWIAYHNDLLLKNSSGAYVIDSGWDEILLDVSTAAKRTAVANIVNGWIDGCAAKGYKAIEPDNLDSYSRSQGKLSRSNALAYAKLLTAHAHARGLAIAQKNDTSVAASGPGTGFDFAIAEECGRYDECDFFTNAYGNHVIVIEYRSVDFTKACKAWGSQLSVVLRDRLVTAPGSGKYQYNAC
jgi:hypothetical protein